MGKALVIVESPAKARTIAGMLGPDFVVESSVGHIRDLPRGADEVPAAYKGEGWAAPRRRRRQRVQAPLRGLRREEVGRRQPEAPPEGRPTSSTSRRTRTARASRSPGTSPRCSRPRSPSSAWSSTRSRRPPSSRAVEESRELDRRLVDAQEARRILDRLYGYEVSPVLWKKVMPRLSAGRVQSVATRMVVERERARMRFRSATWWGVDGTFAAPQGTQDAGDPVTAPAQFAAAAGGSRRARRSPRAGTSTTDGVQVASSGDPGARRPRGGGPRGRPRRPDLHRPLGDRAAAPADPRRRRS